MSNLDLDFDLELVRAKYAAERDKRIRFPKQQVCAGTAGPMHQNS